MPELTSWSLRRRLVAAIALFGIVLVTVVAVSVALLVAVRSEQREVINRYFRAVTITNLRFTDQIDAETAVRGYALTGEPTTLQPIKTIQSAGYRNDLSELSTLVSSDPKILAAFNSWDAAAQQWYDGWAEPTIAKIRAHGVGLSAALVLQGKHLFDTVRARYTQVSNQLVAKRNASGHRLRTLTTFLFVAVVFSVVSVLLAAVALWVALRRWVLKPLDQLGEGTRQVRAGDLDHAVVVHGPRELAAVATDVDQMRSDLVQQLAEVQSVRLALEAVGAALEERAAELARSNRDLEQFAYVASHDLQEPLRKVASFCQLLEQRYQGQLDERADQYIAFAVDGAKRMQQLINDLLAFSRVGRSTSAFTDVALDRCLDAALENLDDLVAATGAEIVRGSLPVVPGDSGLLTQLFQNLVGNALKFHGPQPPRIEVSAERREDDWELCVADNGIGIEPQYAERIFVIFQRLHGKEEYTGTGIGLALCKRIVEHHGGTIWLDPAPEEPTKSTGAAFRWTLPVTARPFTVAPPPTTESTADPQESQQ